MFLFADNINFLYNLQVNAEDGKVIEANGSVPVSLELETTLAKRRKKESEVRKNDNIASVNSIAMNLQSIFKPGPAGDNVKNQCHSQCDNTQWKNFLKS